MSRTLSEPEQRVITLFFALLFCIFVFALTWPKTSVRDKIQIGMSSEQVRSAAGSPSHTQEMQAADGISEYWYYGDVQVCFDNGRVVGINRY